MQQKPKYYATETKVLCNRNKSIIMQQKKCKMDWCSIKRYLVPLSLLLYIIILHLKNNNSWDYLNLQLFQ